MKVTVKVFATLRHNREKEKLMEFEEGMTPRGVLTDMNIPADDVAIIMINGRAVKLDTPLKDEDVLALFPPVGGG